MMGSMAEENLSNDYSLVDFQLPPNEDLMQEFATTMNMGRMAPHVMAQHMPWINPHHHPNMTPGPNNAIGGSQMHHSQIIPGTPPDTPPGSSPNTGSLPPSPPFQCSMSQHSAFIEEKATWPNAYIHAARYNSQELPLDLRPQCGPDQLEHSAWILDRKYEINSHHRSLGASLPSNNKNQQHLGAQNPVQSLQHQQVNYKISDDELIALTVRELNKKLHNMSKEMQSKYKQKRRTLKNRGYAQSCRHKRTLLKHDLEERNNSLEMELQGCRTEINRLRQTYESILKDYEKVKRELDSLKMGHQQQHQPNSSGSNHHQILQHQQANQPEDSTLFHSM